MTALSATGSSRSPSGDWGWYTTLTDNLGPVASRRRRCCRTPDAAASRSGNERMPCRRCPRVTQERALEGAGRRRPARAVVRAARGSGRDRSPSVSDPKIFFATDIHGSDRCLRKFVNAGTFYGVDAVVMGGDITGKMIVPVVEEGGGQVRRAPLRPQAGRRRRRARRAEQVHRRRGLLPAPDDAGRDGGVPGRPARPSRAVPQADERDDEPLDRHRRGPAGRAPGSECIFAPGNDDPFFIDDLLSSSDVGAEPRRPGRRAARRLLDDLGRVLEPDAVGVAARARRARPESG